MDFAQIHLLDAPFSVDRPYTYAIPPHLAEQVRAGRLVTVPFGRGSRPAPGVVTALCDTCDYPQVKSVLSVSDDLFSLTPPMLALALYLCESTLCTVGEAVHALLPPGAIAQKASAKTERNVCSLLSPEEITSVLGGSVKLRSEAHRTVLSFFLEHAGTVPLKELCLRLSVSTAQVTALVERGYLAFGSDEVTRNPYAALGRIRDTAPIVLSRAQMTAYETLSSLRETGEAKAALLFGITGSGKTKVIMRVIDDVISRGKQVIMLVPEIALTPQTVSIFCRRYGARVAVIHSSLSAGERRDAFKRVKEDQVDLVIGTRSAVFAPLPRLGMVVIDEEHEHTYKSESAPKYHARDVAAFRCGQTGALMLLASATPSFESFRKAETGRYTLVPLRERYGSARLPEVEIVDMRQELRKGSTSPFSERLHELMSFSKERQEQTILFINRRGYNASLQCKSCGEALLCPHCSIALTYHTAGGARLKCHCCGYTAPVPKVCPACSSEHLSYVGFGTQKAESELSMTLPGLRVLRMDADTTGTKQSYDRMLDEFRRGEADVLLGTQMVTKGHDFPRVTLVGVLLADLSLYVSDFRAAERTFSLLTQVIGRAGRAEAGGIAVVQTFAPCHEVIRYAKEQDYESFYRSEIELRRTAQFPPFCDIAQLTLVSTDEQALFAAARRLSESIASLAGQGPFADLPLVVFGPFEARIYKIAERFRMQMMVKCRLSAPTRQMFRTLLLSFADDKKVNLSVDFNPLGM